MSKADVAMANIDEVIMASLEKDMPHVRPMIARAAKSVSQCRM